MFFIITQFHELDGQEGEPVQQARDERENKPPEKEPLCGSEKHSTSAEHLARPPSLKWMTPLATLLETAAHVHFAEQLGSYQLTTRM